MKKEGIKKLCLSHNQGMETKLNNQQSLTKDEETRGVYLSHNDAEEYRTYKKRKKLTEISGAFARSSGSLMGGEDTQKTCERATRLKQASVKLPLSKLSQAAFYLSDSGVKLDCVVGGDGETLTKVKAYETKLALRRHAREITLVITPSLTDACRYGEIKREIKRLRRISKRACLKVFVKKKLSTTVLGRLARVASEAGASYFSIPYFLGCEHLRMEMRGGCQLEVCGVETLSDFRRLLDGGVGRIVTEKSWELYSEWLRQESELLASTSTFASGVEAAIKSAPSTKEGEVLEKEPSSVVQTGARETQPLATRGGEGLPHSKTAALNPETNYRCRLEGTELKFL